MYGVKTQPHKLLALTLLCINKKIFIFYFFIIIILFVFQSGNVGTTSPSLSK
jgi:hypothetical protein